MRQTAPDGYGTFDLETGLMMWDIPEPEPEEEPEAETSPEEPESQ